MREVWTLEHAIEIAMIGMHHNEFRADGGGLWTSDVEGPPDATFTDWGMARATAMILNAVRDGSLILKEDADLDMRAAKMDAAIRESKVY